MKDKKDEEIKIRTEAEIRVAFHDACNSIGESMSRVLRDLMAGAIPYIKKHCAQEHRWYPPKLTPGLPAGMEPAVPSLVYPPLPFAPVAAVAGSAPKRTSAHGQATSRRRGGRIEQ